MKERVLDKPRITSTIILGIVSTAAIVATIYSFIFAGSLISEILKENKGGAIIVFILLMPIYLIAGAAVIISQILNLIFSLQNFKSTLKPVRVIALVEVILAALLIVGWIVITIVYFAILQK